jgi:hypothetical protein
MNVCGEEPANLVAISMLLEEKSSANRTLVTLCLTILYGALECHRQAILRVGITTIGPTHVSEANLGVGLYAINEVLRVIAYVSRCGTWWRRWCLSLQGAYILRVVNVLAAIDGDVFLEGCTIRHT